MIYLWNFPLCLLFFYNIIFGLSDCQALFINIYGLSPRARSLGRSPRLYELCPKMYQNSKVVLLPPNWVNRKNNFPRLIHVLKKAHVDKFKICHVWLVLRRHICWARGCDFVIYKKFQETFSSLVPPMYEGWRQLAFQSSSWSVYIGGM